MLSQDWINYSDTTQVINILNGHWKLKHPWGKYDIELKFSKDSMTCYDTEHDHWYMNTPVKYTIEWEWEESCDRIFLRIVPIENPDGYNWRNEIWIINDRLMYIHIGGDFGIYEMTKKKK